MKDKRHTLFLTQFSVVQAHTGHNKLSKAVSNQWIINYIIF